LRIDQEKTRRKKEQERLAAEARLAAELKEREAAEELERKLSIMKSFVEMVSSE